jgi:pimeloyl-ACP methyl ester carboxylesterase
MRTTQEHNPETNRMNRRQFLGDAAMLASATAMAPAALAAEAPATGRRPIILVHGAWHGGWCWERVTPLLEKAGHKVYAPTLAGLAERAGELSREINLDTHARDITSLIERENLREVVLVGHSYAGMVIPLVADRMPQRLHKLVFLDSLLLDAGQSFASLVPPAAWQERLAQVREKGRGVGIPPFPAKAFGIADPADQAWVDSKLTLHPIGTYEQPRALRHAFGNGVPRVYIECTSPSNPGTASSRDKLKSQSGWTHDTVATGHDAMVAAPALTAQVLLKYA